MKCQRQACGKPTRRMYCSPRCRMGVWRGVPPEEIDARREQRAGMYVRALQAARDGATFEDMLARFGRGITRRSRCEARRAR